MIQPSHRLLLLTIIVLGVGLYTLDLYLPLGIGNGVLYGGLVVLSLAIPDRKVPVLVAGTCSVLALSDVFLGVTLPNVPLWMGLSNRMFSLTAIWFPVVYAFQRRKSEEALRNAHNELEIRVEARTRELALVNQALVGEIDKVRPPYNVSVLNCEAALFALEHAPVFAEQARQLREQRSALVAALRAMPGIEKCWDSEANMVLVRVQDAARTFAGLRERKVLIKNVSTMHPLLHNCLRLTVGNAQDNATMLAALQASL